MEDNFALPYAILTIGYKKEKYLYVTLILLTNAWDQKIKQVYDKK